MRILSIGIVAGLVGCTTQAAPPVGVDPTEGGDISGGDGGKADGNGSGATQGIPTVRCDGVPDAGPSGSFSHLGSKITSALGDPRHRGFDLVAPASADTQALEGWISYTIVDKALEDEAVDVFACRANAWQKVGTTRTDDEGHFSLQLSDADRLPIGLRDLYVSVVGDRTGVGFLGFVGPDNSPLLVSDVDGTLTSSEDAFVETITLGIEPDDQPGAPEAYAAAVAKGYTLVYVTARGNQYTEDTRQWLADKGFPLGLVRLSPSFVTLPGGDTIDYKTQTFEALAPGLDLAAGVGNRDSDITAYTNAGFAADRIFIKLPEYQSECQADLDAGKAIGFSAYDDLRTQYIVNF